MPKRAVRIHEDLDGKLQKTAKERGYRTPSAFIRAAIESEVKSRNEMAGMEAQTAASFDRVSQELRRLHRNQQALFRSGRCADPAGHHLRAGASVGNEGAGHRRREGSVQALDPICGASNGNRRSRHIAGVT